MVAPQPIRSPHPHRARSPTTSRKDRRPPHLGQTALPPGPATPHRAQLSVLITPHFSTHAISKPLASSSSCGPGTSYLALDFAESLLCALYVYVARYKPDAERRSGRSVAASMERWAW